MNTFSRILVLFAGIGIVAACGGGGGGGNNLPAEVAITPQNAQQIAGDVVVGVLDVGTLGVLGGSGLIGADQDGPAMSKLTPVMAAKGVELFLAVPFGPEIVNCDVSGTVTLSGNLASPDTLTPGDTITARFADCDDGEGEVINGLMTMSVTSFQGDLFAGLMEVGLAMTFQNLTVTEGSDVYAADGDLDMRMDTRAYPLSTYDMSSSSLTVSDGSDTLAVQDFFLSAETDETAQPLAYTLSSSGRIALPGQGTVSYGSVQPFTGFGDNAPDTGVMSIEGAMGTSITATVLSNVQVQLEMDYDGNGTVDETRTVTWDELGA